MSNISSIDQELIPVTCYLATLALLGGIGNLIIIVATVKSRAMRSTCNMLIFFICIFDFLHLQGQWQYFIYMLTGIEMEKATCFYWQILPLAGLYFCGPLQLAIAIDRLIAVSFPLKYMVLQYHPMKYFLCLFLPPSIYVLISIWYAPCSIEVAFSGETNWFLECILTGSYAVAAITYILVVLIMRIKGANEQFKAVFKAITIYLGLILCTFFFTNVYDLAVEYWIPATRYEKDILHAYAGIAITTCISSNLIVFYCLNRQYRAAVNHLFKCKRRVIVSNSPSAA